MCLLVLFSVDIIVLGSFVLSPSVVKVPGTDWQEPVLMWLSVCKPTGSGKSTLFRHLYSVLKEVRLKCGIQADDPSWIFDDGTLEKLGCMTTVEGSWDHLK